MNPQHIRNEQQRRHQQQLVIDRILLFLLLLLVGLLSIIFFIFFNYIYPSFWSSKTHKHLLTLPSQEEWDSSLPRTPDQQLNVVLELGVVYKGENTKFTVNKHVICDSCSGSGAKSPSDMHVCPSCKGKGFHDVIQQMGFMQFQTRQICGACAGKGITISEFCPKCHGSGTHFHQQDIHIPVPMGIPEGFVVKITHGADQRPNYAPGDLYLHIQTASTEIPEMKRNGDDLHYELSISLREALIGFKKPISHFFGEFLVERSEITPHGQILLFPEKGMPIYQNEGKFGTLYVHISVEFPYILTEEEIVGVKKLLGGEGAGTTTDTTTMEIEEREEL